MHLHYETVELRIRVREKRDREVGSAVLILKFGKRDMRQEIRVGMDKYMLSILA